MERIETGPISLVNPVLALVGGGLLHRKAYIFQCCREWPGFTIARDESFGKPGRQVYHHVNPAEQDVEPRCVSTRSVRLMAN